MIEKIIFINIFERDVHESKLQKCSICNKEYTSLINLKTHIKVGLIYIYILKRRFSSIPGSGHTLRLDLLVI